MGTRERREREKENLRRAILDAARELFVREGFEAVTMRKIAASIEYSATTIYLHFADKEAILDALCEEGFGLLAEQLYRESSCPDPIERLRRGAKRYFNFAREHRSYYTIMFEIKENPLERVTKDRDADSEMAMPYHAFSFILGAVVEARQKGMIPSTIIAAVETGVLPVSALVGGDFVTCLDLSLLPEAVLAHVVWSGLHGIASLWLSGRLGMIPAELHPFLLESTVENLLRGLTCGEASSAA